MCGCDFAEELRDRVEYDPDSDTYHLHYDWTEIEPASTAVSVVVAHALDVEPTETESIDNTIDPDTLDRLFHPDWTDASREDGAHLTFGLMGCRVTIHRSGEIVVRPPEHTSE